MIHVAGATWRETEFWPGVRDPQTGATVNLYGACGPNALAMLASWSLQKYISTVSVYMLLRKNRQCDLDGVSNIGGLAYGASALKLPGVQVAWYRNPWPGWRAWLLTQVQAGRAVLVEVSEGYVLRDAVTGQGENANTDPASPNRLRFHFLLVLGYDPATRMWLCADGDNLAGGNYRANGFRASNVLQHYPDALFSAAAPVAAIAAGLKAAPLKTGASKMSTTTGAGAGFDSYCAAHGVTAKLVAYGALSASESFAAYANGLILHWAAGADVRDDQAAVVVARLAAAQVAQKAQIAHLSAALSAAPKAAAPDVHTAAAVAAVTALKQALS